MLRTAPSGLIVSTVASSARMATAISLGCVAMQASLTPMTACCRVKSADRSAAAAGLAFVARLVGVVEIGTSRALEQVAGGCRLIAQLAGGARKQRAREQAIVAPHARIGGKIGVAHQRADAQPAFGCRSRSCPARGRSRRSDVSAFRSAASSDRAGSCRLQRTWHP